jgi:hypothetical protein
MGASGDDACHDLAVAGDGAAYAIGTRQDDSTGPNLYAQSVAPDGVSSYMWLIWSGLGDEEGMAIIPLDDGTFYFAGTTTTVGLLDGFSGGFDGSHNGGVDIFLVHMGASFIATTYVGGSGDDVVESMARGEDGALYLTGHTDSSDFPAATGPGFDTTADGTHEDAFVVKLTADLSTVTYATYLGGSGDDAGMSIAVDGDGAAYVAGTTDSDDFPATGGAYQAARRGGEDAFVAKWRRTACHSSTPPTWAGRATTRAPASRRIASGRPTWPAPPLRPISRRRAGPATTRALGAPPTVTWSS